MAELVTRARWFIDSSGQRNKKLTRLKTYSETDESELEHAYGAGEDGPVGVIDKPGGGSLELEYYHNTGDPEVDWRALKKAKEFFTLVKQNVGGERVQYTRCRVANVASQGDDQGSHMQTIKILWATREDL